MTENNFQVVPYRLLKFRLIVFHYRTVAYPCACVSFIVSLSTAAVTGCPGRYILSI
jgi:hypothetical protein